MKVKFILRLLLTHLVALFFLLTAPAAAGAKLVQVVNSGCVDWGTGTVRASGVGAPADPESSQAAEATMSIHDSARQSAQAHLMETVKSIRIDAETWVVDRLANDEAFREGLYSLVSNASITRQEYLSDGTLEVELSMGLTGGFAQFVLPEGIRQVEAVTTVTAGQPDRKSPPGEKDDAPPPPHTGLIVDATGIGAQPSLVPEVVDESGEVVYGSAFVSREFAVSRGMSGFAATLDAARKDPRVGSHPMIVKAVRTGSTANTDLVISTTDAARLRSSAAHLEFLKACRVSIIIDPAENP